MANTVKNAKNAARKLLTAVVDGVVKAKGKGKTVRVKELKPGDATGKGQTVKVSVSDTDDKPPASKDTDDKPAVSKGKKRKAKPAGSKGKKRKAKPADLSEPRSPLSKAERKGLHKAVDADSVSRATNTLGRGAARATVFGHSASAVWRALGYAHDDDGNGLYTRSDCLALRDGLGLDGVIKDANCNLQFGDGRGRYKGNDPLYGGDVPELTTADWKVVNAIVKAARES